MHQAEKRKQKYKYYSAGYVVFVRCVAAIHFSASRLETVFRIVVSAVGQAAGRSAL
jgi:hypothetical protein